MTYFGPIVSIVLYFVAAILALYLGAKKGAVAYLIAVVAIAVIALALSPLWILTLPLLLPLTLIAGGLGIASGVRLRQMPTLVAGEPGVSSGLKSRQRIGLLVLVSPIVAYAAYTVAKEIKKKHELDLVVAFVKLDNRIAQAAGQGIVVGEPGGWTMPTSSFPFRYELFVSGANTKGLYAMVDVSRPWAWGEPGFSIACLTPLPVASRDPTIDVCKQ